jgi:hypothetical protein
MRRTPSAPKSPAVPHRQSATGRAHPSHSRSAWREAARAVLTRVQFCLALTLVVAVAFIGYVLLLYLFRGSAPFAANGTTLGTTILAYLAGGALSGIVLGILLPLGRTRLGAALVGIASVLPMYTAVGVAVEGVGALTWEGWLDTAVPSIFTGAALGLLAWWYLNR